MPDVFRPTHHGFVSLRQPGTPTAVASGPRLAVLDDGSVLCSFMAQSNLGINDFVPLLARSNDQGVTWSPAAPIWPHLVGKWSIFGSISRGVGGELLYFGARYRIDQPGESFWSDATSGLKQNELLWARSRDGGRTWSEPTVIPMPIPGSAEAPGAMCVTRRNHWRACYAPYNTFDPNLKVDRSQIALVASEDQGRTWRYVPMMRFADGNDGGAEAWVVELADGRLVGACWHVSHASKADYPTPYTLSRDGGRTWLPPTPVGVQGHTTALCPLADGRVLLLYVQRKSGEPGIWLARGNPDEQGFGLDANQRIWSMEAVRQRGGVADHTQWTDFTFGEPAAAILPSGEVLVVLWFVGKEQRGIACARLTMA